MTEQNQTVEDAFNQFISTIPQPESMLRKEKYFEFLHKFTKLYVEMKTELLTTPDNIPAKQ